MRPMMPFKEDSKGAKRSLGIEGKLFVEERAYTIHVPAIEGDMFGFADVVCSYFGALTRLRRVGD
jgi:hypothetical protein